MRTFCYCLRKDCIEFMRAKKNIIFSGILLVLGIMVLGMTQLFPFLIESLMKQSPDFISDPLAINEMMEKLFPKDTKASLGIWSADVGVFYTIAIVLMVYGILPSEIKSGKWIFPIAAGYKNSYLILSKSLVYSCGAAIPVTVMYNLYYLVASLQLKSNYEIQNVIFNSIILGVCIFSIVNITILLSLLYKQTIINAVSMIVMIIAVPDIMTLFSFGKYFPTYLLTYVYSSLTNYTEVVIPMLELIVIQVFIGKLAIKKSNRLEMER